MPNYVIYLIFESAYFKATRAALSDGGQVGDNLKIGGGYNFGSFSEDLRDQMLDDRGWFVNVLAKF